MSSKKKNASRSFRAKNEWTISEFHSWLDGFCAAQEATSQDGAWTPNADQWQLILEIIYKLKPSTIIKRPVTPQQPVPYAPEPVQPQTFSGQPEPSVLQTPGNDVFGNLAGNPNPAFDPSTFGNDVALPDVQAAIRRGDVVSSGKGKVKTPNIDTSKGYSSGFD